MLLISSIKNVLFGALHYKKGLFRTHTKTVIYNILSLDLDVFRCH